LLNGKVLNDDDQEISKEKKWGCYVSHANGKIIGFAMAKG